MGILKELASIYGDNPVEPDARKPATPKQIHDVLNQDELSFEQQVDRHLPMDRDLEIKESR